MKVVIAPDSFKESLPASEAAAALAAGVLDACPDAVVDLCPMADGGEGTVEAMVAAAGGEVLTADVFDPLGAPIRARFALLAASADAPLPGQLGLVAALQRADGEESGPSGGVAVIEMASASGLALVSPDRRDPLRATSFGTGQLIIAALDSGARQIIVGLGGSGTTDGGCGCAQAMGVRFTGTGGEPTICGLGGGALIDIEDFDISTRDARLEETRIRVACDVRNPLLGPNGAAAVYAPQKGATEEVVGMLEAGLSHLAALIHSKLGLDVASLAGAGAAGGLGAGLVAFADAELCDGFDVVAEAVDLKKRLHDADICITGEGKLDGQSLAGKVTVSVAKIADELGVATVCIPGQAAVDAPREVFRSVRPLVAGSVTVRDAMAQARRLLEQRAAEAVKESVGS